MTVTELMYKLSMIENKDVEVVFDCLGVNETVENVDVVNEFYLGDEVSIKAKCVKLH